MQNIEKIDIINQRLNNLQYHIDILMQDIIEYPEADVEGKPTRQQVLDDFLLKKETLISEKDILTNLI